MLAKISRPEHDEIDDEPEASVPEEELTAKGWAEKRRRAGGAESMDSEEGGAGGPVTQAAGRRYSSLGIMLFMVEAALNRQRTPQDSARQYFALVSRSLLGAEVALLGRADAADRKRMRVLTATGTSYISGDELIVGQDEVLAEMIRSRSIKAQSMNGNVVRMYCPLYSDDQSLMGILVIVKESAL